MRRTTPSLKCLFLTLLLSASVGLQAQQIATVTGRVKEKNSGTAVPFATIWLTCLNGGLPRTITPAASDKTGLFSFPGVPAGRYLLRVTSVGYREASKDISISGAHTHEAGLILLEDSTYLITEAVIVAERITVKTETDKLVYPVSSKMVAASGNTADILRFIPGVQVDLKQNITLNGSGEILFLVDGRERDKGYVSRITPSLISRVEVIRMPPPEFSGEASGVINIILKKERSRGFTGQLYTDIPTTESFVYSFPSASLHYSFGKINLQISYSGEINYEHIDETDSMLIRLTPQPLQITTLEQVRQRNLSHKFHYGIEFQLTPNDMLSYQGSCNQYSYEQDGNMLIKVTGRDEQILNSIREENDRNLNLYNSLYYKHHDFDRGTALSVDLNHAYLRAGNNITFTGRESEEPFSVINKENPTEHAVNMKVDGSYHAGKRTVLNGGLHAQHHSMRDSSSIDFSYKEQIYALYGTVLFKSAGSHLKTGIRAEYAKSDLREHHSKAKITLLPFFSYQLMLKGAQEITFSYRRGIKRPSIFQLNPSRYILSPYAVQSGNHLLKPFSSHSLYTEYSLRFRDNHFSLRLFYDKQEEVINPLTLVIGENMLVTRPHNLGDMHISGMQMTGVFKSGPITFYPSIRLYKQQTRVNSLAVESGIEDRDNLVFESDFASIMSLRHNITLSASLQYSTPKINIQSTSFSSALYTLSLDKTFGKNLKIGIMTALPFVSSFVYQGSKTNTEQFYRYDTGNLKLPDVPVMLRLSWRFQGGKVKKVTEREHDALSGKPRAGF